MSRAPRRRTVWLLLAACMLALTVLGIAAALAPSGLGGLVLLVGPVAPARGVVGLLGLGGWLLFLTRFEAMFESEVPAIGMSLSWEAGAYLALAGWCGLLVLGGFRNAREIWQTPHAADRYRGDPSPPAG